jgi:hypothetical protein
VTQEAATSVLYLIDIFLGKIHLGSVEHHVVLRVFRILYRAQERIGPPAQHDVERMEADVALVEHGRGGERKGREQLYQEHGDDEAASNGVGPHRLSSRPINRR